MKTFKAFTLVEIIIYVAISSMVLFVILQFSWNILGNQTRVDTAVELEENGRFILEQLTRDIRSAANIDLAASALAQNPGRLVLLMADDSRIIYDTYIKEEIIKIRRSASDNPPQDVTSNKISVSALSFYNRTRGSETKSIKIELTLVALNSDRQFALTTAVTLRK